MLDLAQDIYPLSDFKRKTGELLDHLKGTGRPILLTLNGRPQVVVLDAAAYQRMLDELQEARNGQ